MKKIALIFASILLLSNISFASKAADNMCEVARTAAGYSDARGYCVGTTNTLSFWTCVFNQIKKGNDWADARGYCAGE